jgi:hypothetical protein
MHRQTRPRVVYAVFVYILPRLIVAEIQVAFNGGGHDVGMRQLGATAMQADCCRQCRAHTGRRAQTDDAAHALTAGDNVCAHTADGVASAVEGLTTFWSA